MDYTEFEQFIAQSSAYTKGRQELAKRQFGLGDYERYIFDPFLREIWWSNSDGPKVRGRVTIVGTISTESDTWLWGWAHDEFKVGGCIEEVRQFGEREGIPKLTEASWPAEEIDGWEMTCVSARLLESQGVYRSPRSQGFLFLLFDNLEFIPAEDIERYLPQDG